MDSTNSQVQVEAGRNITPADLDHPHPGSQMECRNLLEDRDFLQRNMLGRDPTRESVALRRLAQIFVDHPEEVLGELTQITLDFCGADSAGISLEDRVDGKLVLRWVETSGEFSRFRGRTIPVTSSPCGICLERHLPQHFRVNQGYFDRLGIEADPVTDGIVIPLAAEVTRGTIWVMAHNSAAAFDLGDYKFLAGLRDFTTLVIRHQLHEAALSRRNWEAASSATANRLAHLINNPLQSLMNTIYLAQSSGDDARIYLAGAAEQLKHISELVMKILHSTAAFRESEVQGD